MVPRFLLLGVYTLYCPDGLHDVTKVKRFCRCSQGLKSVDFEFIKRKAVMGEFGLIRQVLKKLGEPFVKEETEMLLLALKK